MSHQSGDFCLVMRYPASLLPPLKRSAQVDMTPGLSTVKKISNSHVFTLQMLN